VDNRFVVVLDPDLLTKIVERLSGLQSGCKKEKAPALAALMAKFSGLTSDLSRVGYPSLAFDPESEFEMDQLYLLSLATTASPEEAAQIVESFKTKAKEVEKAQHAAIVEWVGRYLPAKNPALLS
jgi:hypothetical protein